MTRIVDKFWSGAEPARAKSTASIIDTIKTNLITIKKYTIKSVLTHFKALAFFQAFFNPLKYWIQLEF